MKNINVNTMYKFVSNKYQQSLFSVKELSKSGTVLICQNSRIRILAVMYILSLQPRIDPGVGRPSRVTPRPYKFDTLN